LKCPFRLYDSNGVEAFAYPHRHTAEWVALLRADLTLCELVPRQLPPPPPPEPPQPTAFFGPDDDRRECRYDLVRDRLVDLHGHPYACSAGSDFANALELLAWTQHWADSRPPRPPRPTAFFGPEFAVGRTECRYDPHGDRLETLLGSTYYCRTSEDFTTAVKLVAQTREWVAAGGVACP
jgi:hypothetical protein